MSRATGFSTTTISAWRRGKVALPQLETRRRLASELGITHVQLLVAMGELTEEEVNLPEDPRSDAVRFLSPAIDAYEWREGDLEHLRNMINAQGSWANARVDRSGMFTDN